MIKVRIDSSEPRWRGARWRLMRVPAAVAAIAGLLAFAIAACVAKQPHGDPAAHSGQAQPGPSAPVLVPAPRGPTLLPRHTPPPAPHAMFGAYVQPTAGGLASEVESVTVRLERALGRKLAIQELYVRFAAAMPLKVAQWDLRGGRIPLISWAGARTDLIAAGAYDSLIRSRALQLKALHGPVMLRWFAEMEGVLNRANAVSPASFIAAWRHMHRIFASAGATNVAWVWCPNASGFISGRAKPFYPGGAYVDWIGADGYSWAPNIPRATWRSFEQIFADFYLWARATGKPLLVGEYGVLERAPGEKAAWFTQADGQIRTEFPAIRAVIYFNSNHYDSGRYFDWRVTSSSSAFAAFRSFAHDPYFGLRPLM